MKTIRNAAAMTITALLALPTLAEPAHRLGDHPAVVVQRLHAKQGYDYASKFYPHPAWLYLIPEPREVEAVATAPQSRSTIAPAATRALARADVE